MGNYIIFSGIFGVTGQLCCAITLMNSSGWAMVMLIACPSVFSMCRI